MAKIGQLILNRGSWNGAQVVSENWIDAATAPQIKTTYGEPYGYQFWLGASSISGRQIKWIAARGQGGQWILMIPTLDLIVVMTAGNYYGNDYLVSLVTQTVFNDYVLPSIDGDVDDWHG